MPRGVILGESQGDIDWRVHTDFVSGIHHGSSKVKARFHGRMLDAVFGWIIGKAVMALGEDCDAVEVPKFQSLLKLLFIESLPNIRDIGAGVKIQMDLPRRQLSDPVCHVLPPLSS